MIVKNRIKDHQEFQEVIAKGALKKSKSISMYYFDNTLGYTRIGISVPKKSGSAVIRNKIKRQIRSICGQLIDFNKSIDVVFIVRKAYNIDNFNETKEEIKELLNR